MRFSFDHDYHIHSQLSLCSNDPNQTPESILEYAEKAGLREICITDHFWDSDVPGASSWYAKQDFEHISKALPLPKSDKVTFFFGCETDMDKFMTVGVSESRFDRFDFIIIPTTHLHMKGFTFNEEDGRTAEGRARLWVERLDSLLNQPLPFHKIGIAHLACGLTAPASREMLLEVLNLIPEDEMVRLFTKAASLGVGIELNSSDMNFADSEADTVLRMFRIAKSCGCKFYLGSDIHHPANVEKLTAVFNRAIDLLGLTEDDRFTIRK